MRLQPSKATIRKTLGTPEVEKTNSLPRAQHYIFRPATPETSEETCEKVRKAGVVILGFAVCNVFILSLLSTTFHLDAYAPSGACFYDFLNHTASK